MSIGLLEFTAPVVTRIYSTPAPPYSHAPAVLSQPTEAVKMRKIGYSHDTSKAIILTQTNSPPPLPPSQEKLDE